MSFAVLVELIKKPSREVVTSEKPFFDPSAITRKKNTSMVTQPSEVFSTGASPVQASRDVAASLIATQPVEADGAKVATQPVEAPGARSVVHSQPIGTGSEDVRLVDPSLTSKKTVPVGLLVCRLTLTQKMTYSDPGSPAGTSEEQVSFHTGTPLEIKTWTRSCLKKPTTSKP